MFQKHSLKIHYLLTRINFTPPNRDWCCVAACRPRSYPAGTACVSDGAAPERAGTNDLAGRSTALRCVSHFFLFLWDFQKKRQVRNANS